MCRKGAPCGCSGSSSPLGWLVTAAGVAASGAAAAWAWELAVIAAGGGVLIAAACWAAITVGKRHMVTGWRPGEVSGARIEREAVTAARVRSHRPVAGSEQVAGVAARIIRGEVEQ